MPLKKPDSHQRWTGCSECMSRGQLTSINVHTMYPVHKKCHVESLFEDEMKYRTVCKGRGFVYTHDDQMYQQVKKT